MKEEGERREKGGREEGEGRERREGGGQLYLQVSVDHMLLMAILY